MSARLGGMTPPWRLLKDSIARSTQSWRILHKGKPLAVLGLGRWLRTLGLLPEDVGFG